jgi:16S rRNA C967 or C1407 C5-methylase (RsmB/RsmF family)/NOL1/NOP2/fmu family ribosome biogenesis protein
MEKWDHFDPDAFQAVHDSGKQLLSVHMNPGKPIFINGQWAKNISELPFHISGSVPWAPDAYYLSERPSFTLDPFFHAGNYYVQEASGMFLAHVIEQILDQIQNPIVLDLCAAPGGKSTLLQSVLPPESLLVSNEVIKTRVPVLYQNMTKWGGANGFVSNNDPAHFKQLPGFFDMIVIDAPCSGSGLFRKDPDAAKNWSVDLVNLCSQRQQRILNDSWDCLKEDGFLIYSTCSYSKEENEDILDEIFQSHACISIPLQTHPLWHIIKTNSNEAGAHGYRFYPDKLSGEGFFISVVQKKQVAGNIRAKKSKNPAFRLTAAVEKQVRRWLPEGELNLISVGEAVHALPASCIHEFEILRNTLYLKKAGIRLGKAGESEWIPDHELALANIMKEDVPLMEIGRTDALRFLRGEPFDFDLDEKGWRIPVFQGQRLGWVKLLGKRMNNYYPKSWRIRQ